MTPRKPRGVLVQAVVPPEIVAWLRASAQADGLSVSATICRLLVRLRASTRRRDR